MGPCVGRRGNTVGIADGERLVDGSSRGDGSHAPPPPILSHGKGGREERGRDVPLLLRDVKKKLQVLYFGRFLTHKPPPKTNTQSAHLTCFGKALFKWSCEGAWYRRGNEQSVVGARRYHSVSRCFFRVRARDHTHTHTRDDKLCHKSEIAACVSRAGVKCGNVLQVCCARSLHSTCSLMTLFKVQSMLCSAALLPLQNSPRSSTKTHSVPVQVLSSLFFSANIWGVEAK